MPGHHDTPDPRDARTVRRTIHANPELGFCEIQTASLIWQTLDHLGWRVSGGTSLVDLRHAEGLPDTETLERAAARARTSGLPTALTDNLSGGSTALIGELDGDTPGPTVGIRVDMDALPITEATSAHHRPTAEGFASRHPGIMHACGHDGHIAIALNLAARLTADHRFPGCVRLLFQPAEEGVRGAGPIVRAGLCDDLDTLLVLHLGFGPPLGTTAPATGLLATTKLEATFRGRAAHASKAPQEGRHALLAAATATLALHTLPAFSEATSRTNVGALLCPGIANIVPAEAMIRAEVRASTAAAHESLRHRAGQAIKSAASMHGTDAAIRITGQAETTQNDPPLVEALQAAARASEIDRIADQELEASDDATLMMNRVRSRGGTALYFLVGSGSFGPQHSPLFDIDESALDIGVRLLDHMIRHNKCVR